MAEIHYQRLRALRDLMEENGWDAVIISGSDPHGSEYPAPRWKQVEWLSGFTGEAGDMVVTRDHAGLWTDSRYFIQALNELEGSGVALHKTRVPDAVDIPRWLSGRADVVAFDGTCLTVEAVDELRRCLPSAELADVPDLFDRIWTDRPPVPRSPVMTLDDETTGESRFRKLSWLRKFLLSEGCDCMLLSKLDEIAWLLNVRGSDIEYNPLVISHLLVTMDEAFWLVRKNEDDSEDPDTADSLEELASDGVTVCRYDSLADIVEAAAGEGGRVFFDPSSTNYDTFTLMYDSFRDENMLSGVSPVGLRKAVKNQVEIAGMREACHADGIAMEKFLRWLDLRLESGVEVTEWEASLRLTAFRGETPGYRGDSFRNISAYGPSAALPHYSTQESGSSVIEPRGLYLVDSGGQYMFGTTDITRTVPVGECSDAEKEDYTLVLKGMIALARAVFPAGTAGCQLDVLARNALWSRRRNFGHGTGHGVGFYLCVHEGPQDIRQNFNSQPLLPGMVTSDEPGIYREGLYGIRHENLLLCTEAGRNQFGEWLRFETLTLCHIDTGPVIRDLMTDDEIRWLNDYNLHVYETLSPDLDFETAEWLREKTRSI